MRVLAREGPYLRSLSEHVISGELELDRLTEMPDEEVIRELTAVKGIGEWTAHTVRVVPHRLETEIVQGMRTVHYCRKTDLRRATISVIVEAEPRTSHI